MIQDGELLIPQSSIENQKSKIENGLLGVTPQCCVRPPPYLLFMKLDNKFKVAALAFFSAVSLSLLTVGCERTVSKTEETKVNSDGTVQQKQKTVTEAPDGTVTKTETKKSS